MKIVSLDLRIKMEFIIFRFVVNEFLQPAYWRLPVSGISDDSDHFNPEKGNLISILPISMERLNSNIILSCLLLDCIGVCATLLGTEFDFILIDLLYPLLEKLGSTNARTSSHALLTLKDVAKATGCQNVAILISRNADYLVNSVSLKLRHISRHPEVLSVLRVILQYSDREVLPLVNDTITEVRIFLKLVSKEISTRHMCLGPA